MAFVQAGRRRFESFAGLHHLGVPLHRQVYLGLSDGSLFEEQDTLEAELADILDWFQPNRLFTTGHDGYDGHLDHIATHETAFRALKLLGLAGVAGYELDSMHEGEFVVPPTEIKLGAMAMHSSQRVIPDLTRWGGVDTYSQLIIGPETYSVVH